MNGNFEKERKISLTNIQFYLTVNEFSKNLQLMPLKNLNH